MQQAQEQCRLASARSFADASDVHCTCLLSTEGWAHVLARRRLAAPARQRGMPTSRATMSREKMTMMAMMPPRLMLVWHLRVCLQLRHEPPDPAQNRCSEMACA